MLDVQWSTVIFQIVNFVILLAVLTRFLYRPVVRTMRERQDAIAGRLREADERTAQAEAEREHLAQVIRHSETQAEEILATARAQADAERTRLIETARTDAVRYRDEAQRAMREQEREELTRLESRIRGTALSMAGALIRQSAGPLVHQALVDQLLRGEVRANGALRPAPGRPSPSIVVELAYAPDPELQDRLQALVAAQSASAKVAFRVNADLVAGARIIVGQQAVVDLSLKRTLADLQVESAA